MKKYSQAILFFVTAVLLTGLNGFAVEKTNVVIIYGDDVGYGDVGVYGSNKIATPNLDQLAREGLRFTDGHCSASTCTPSRYSLLTGEMPYRKKGTGIARGNANMIISPDQFTLADVFQQSGYKTAVIGKWHLLAMRKAGHIRKPAFRNKGRGGKRYGHIRDFPGTEQIRSCSHF